MHQERGGAGLAALLKLGAHGALGGGAEGQEATLEVGDEAAQELDAPGGAVVFVQAGGGVHQDEGAHTVGVTGGEALGDHAAQGPADEREGAAVAAVMHDLTLALQADRVLVMAAGRVLADGAPGSPALHAAIVEVFDGSLRIAAVPGPAGSCWVALPAL